MNEIKLDVLIKDKDERVKQLLGAGMVSDGADVLIDIKSRTMLLFQVSPKSNIIINPKSIMLEVNSKQVIDLFHLVDVFWSIKTCSLLQAVLETL